MSGKIPAPPSKIPSVEEFKVAMLNKYGNSAYGETLQHLISTCAEAAHSVLMRAYRMEPIIQKSINIPQSNKLIKVKRCYACNSILIYPNKSCDICGCLNKWKNK